MKKVTGIGGILNFMGYRLTILLVFLFVLKGCRSLPSEYMSHKEIENLSRESVSKQYPVLAWEYSYIGEYKKSLEAFDDYYKATNQVVPHPEIDLPRHFVAEDAREYIIRKSSGEKVIMINEAHHQPMHRVFTESLLEALYEKGFRFLALEALVSDSKINETKVLTLHDGYYTKEPQFGSLILKALALGYHVFGYEYTDHDISRELGQAKNIYKVLEQNPDAKILVHCGFNHLVEDRHPDGIRSMAQELKSLADIDPLTIDQVEFSEYSDPAFEHPLYRFFHVENPSVLLDDHDRLLPLNGENSIVDMRIIHPGTGLIHGRPGWLYRNGSRKSHYLSGKNINVQFPCTVFAYKQDDFDFRNVPVDVIEINNFREKALVLPTGKFRVYIRDRAGRVSHTSVVVE